MVESSSYGKVLRSSAIMGGALGINYLLGLVRVKVIAVLLGPGGVGILSLYTAAINGIGTVSGLGISSSSVRAIAEASAKGDAVAIARATKTLRFACWGTGLLGWLLAAGLAYPVSDLMFKSRAHAAAIAILGITLLFTAISNGQMALLQGLRRIGDIARANVIGTVANTAIGVAIYIWLGRDGIVPVLIVSAIVSLTVSWRLARRIELAPIAMNWNERWRETRPLVGLGVAFMLSAMLVSALDLLTRTVITRTLGLDAAGNYQAAWSLSGMFAGFVLSAMGTDFYPRLTAVIRDRQNAARLINEQTEIGVLLVLPGLVGTMVFAPLVIQIFYTARFSQSAALLPWFILGIFGRVLSWPMGFIMLAQAASRWFVATETIFAAIQAGLILTLVPRVGIVGAAYAFVAVYVLYTACMLWVSRLLIGFAWSSATFKLLFLSLVLIVSTLATHFLIAGGASLVFGGLSTLLASLLSLHGLAVRLGNESRLGRLVSSVPGGKWFLNL